MTKGRRPAGDARAGIEAQATERRIIGLAGWSFPSTRAQPVRTALVVSYAFAAGAALHQTCSFSQERHRSRELALAEGFTRHLQIVSGKQTTGRSRAIRDPNAIHTSP